MTDYYFSAPTAEALITAFSEPTVTPKVRFQTVFGNVIAPVQGRAATPETTDANGNVIPAKLACGDPALWYCCICCYDAIIPPESVTEVDPAIGASVCGVWA